MRRLISAVAVLATSACSSGPVAVSPSGVDQPRPSLLAPSSPGARALQENCTLTQGFWRNHEDAWPVEELTLGDVTYTQAELVVVLSTPPRGGDVTYILAHQLIAAKLNVAHGADASAIETTLAEADAFLAANPLGSRPRGDVRDAGLELAAALDDFNNGVTGPGHCDETPLPEPTPSPTPTPDPGG